MKTQIELLKEKVRSARSLAVLTGAGVSAESGVPTFRGEQGLWRNYNPMELATPEAFEADPFLVWEWYDWRRSLISKIQPNPAHYALAELEKTHLNFTLITQNVDGLHGLAGSRKVIELHGSIWIVRCVECGNSSENKDVPIKILPRCSCGGASSARGRLVRRVASGRGAFQGFRGIVERRRDARHRHLGCGPASCFPCLAGKGGRCLCGRDKPGRDAPFTHG